MIENPKVSAASVALPNTGNVVWFVDTDGKLKGKDDAGNLIDMTGLGYAGVTSSTSITGGTGSKTFTVNKSADMTAFAAGQRVRMYSNATPSSYVEGLITSYTTTTLVINVDKAIGTIAGITDWRLSSVGDTGSIGVGYSGLTSGSTLTPAIGPQSFIVNLASTNMAFTAGNRVRVVDNANVNNWFEGVIASYSSQNMTVTADKVSSTVTSASSWKIGITGDIGNTGNGFTALTSTTSITPAFNVSQVLTVSAAVGTTGNAFVANQWVYVYASADNWFIGQITAYTTTSMTILPTVVGRSLATAASWTITLAARAGSIYSASTTSDGIHQKVLAETLTQAQEATLQAAQSNGARGLILLNHVRGGSTADGSGTAKGRMLPAFASNQGVCSLQPHFSDVCSSVLAYIGSNTTSVTYQGGFWTLSTATAVPFVDSVYGAFDKALLATAATAASTSSAREVARYSRRTGFHFIAHCNPFGSGANANTRWFAGLDNAVFTNVALTSGNPTQSRVGFCFDPAQTTLRVITSVSGTGTLSVVDLGVNFPTNNASVWYKLELFLEPSGTEIFYRAEKYDTSNLLPSAITEGSFTTTANFPSATLALAPNVTIMTTAAAAVGMHIGKVVVEKQF